MMRRRRGGNGVSKAGIVMTSMRAMRYRLPEVVAAAVPCQPSLPPHNPTTFRPERVLHFFDFAGKGASERASKARVGCGCECARALCKS